MTNPILTTTLIGASLFMGASLLSADKAPVEPVHKTSAGVAIQGYDAVAYFTGAKAVKGNPQFTADWNGARWQFETAENRDKFRGDPAKFAPQFGGYCAWAVGHNYTAPADPKIWKIVDGKLYLNYNQAVKDKWEPEASKWIPDGDKNWPGLHK